MKIGFFGGAFNPPTKAHIFLAQKAKNICNLDKVIFVPMSDLYEKENLAKAEDRYNMLNIICQNKDMKNIEVSDIEIKLNKKLDAIDAFRLIQREYDKDEVYYIMGADNFVKLKEWKNSEELMNKYKYIVLERENIDLSEYIYVNKSINSCIFKVIDNEEYKNYSSTKFRNNINAEIVPNEVLNYIQEKNIYKKIKKFKKN